MSALIQGSREWLEFRRNKVGASDAPVIMGESIWRTPYQLWQEKLGLVELITTPHMQRGLDLEETARQAFENETGNFVFPKVKVSDTYPWMMASLDGIDIEGKVAVEIKCPGVYDHKSAVEGTIPKKYFAQLQQQMVVFNLDQISYFSYTHYSTAHIICKRDENYIKSMIPKLKDFHDRLMDFIPPEYDDRDFIKKADPIWNQYSKSYIEIDRQIKMLEQERETIKSSLVTCAEGRNATGSGLKLSKSFRKGSIDYCNIPELTEVNLEKYRKKPVESWRISFEKEAKDVIVSGKQD